MIIHSMTASFGRLEKETLELQEGLNIIHAPNEWGKSTWCAFLRCMLYGVDTARREKAGHKPDKIRYAPWSGAPMSGIMDIRWQGREIRLRRDTRLPSAPMREFAAVYTADGQPVSGLTGPDAGELITGVGEEVFRRTAFIPQGGLSVTGGADLEKKIAALVTAGEEDASCTEALERLRSWQRRRRWRGKGRLPELEEELERVKQQLASMERFQSELAAAEERSAVLDRQLAEAQQKQRIEQFDRREEALVRLEKAQTRLHQLEETAQLRRREAEERCQKLKESVFAGAEPALAARQAKEDIAAAAARKPLCPRWAWVVPVLLFFGLAAIFGGSLSAPWLMYVGIGLLVSGVVCACFLFRQYRKEKNAVPPVYRARGVSSEAELLALLQQYTADWQRAEAAVRLARQVRQEADRARQELRERQAQMFEPAGEDSSTPDALSHVRQELQQLRETKAALKTRLEILGDPLVLSSRLQQLLREKQQLEEEYEALELACRELQEADRMLQSEFLPRLARRTEYWMGRLTGGRYCEVSLSRELEAMVRRQEDILPRESAYLSGGTADQLYLALRMALCELVLAGEEPCPLVLDDALVAFDDERLGFALEALGELSQSRQVLLFTCQDREERYWNNRNRGGKT